MDESEGTEDERSILEEPVQSDVIKFFKKKKGGVGKQCLLKG
jgi:hypothetical protein